MNRDHLALFAALQRVVDASERHIQAVATVLGVHRSDAAALAHVHQAEAVRAEVNATDIARVTRLSAPATSALLARLESAGHLTRAPDPRDGRRVTIRLTDHGRAALTAPLHQLLEGIAEVLDRHPTAALEAAASLLADVADVVDRASTDLGQQPDHIPVIKHT